jgi:hypothetical protein
MASNLACIGIRVDEVSDLHWLIGEIMNVAKPIQRPDGRLEYRWQDPSGSRLSFALQNGEISEFMPSFAGGTSLDLGRVIEETDGIFVVDILDSRGEIATRAGVDVHDLSAFRAWAESGSAAGVAQLTAFGVHLSIHENGEYFLASEESLLSPESSIEDGVVSRWAVESFMSFGGFGNDEPTATAHLSGTVISADRRIMELTGESFVAARVRTSSFEVDLCFPSLPDVSVPIPGNVVTGIVYLVATEVGDRSFEAVPRTRASRQTLDKAIRWLRGRQ